MIGAPIFTADGIMVHYDDLVFRLQGPSLHGVIVCAAAPGCESLRMVGFLRILMRTTSCRSLLMSPSGVVVSFLLTEKETDHSPWRWIGDDD